MNSVMGDMELQPPWFGWILECDFPPIAVLRLPEGASLLCLMCKAKSDWLFPYACQLSATEAGSGEVDEIDCGEQDAHLKVLASASTAYWGYTACISRCSGGKHNGVQAIGFGSNNITRKRAGRVALAVTMRIKAKGGMIEDPSGDGAYAKLVSRVQRLLSDTGGTTFSLRELTRSMPPPPPGVPRYESTDLPSSGRWLEQERQQDTVSHEGLQGRLATATAAYAAERDGYLPLRPDDCIVLECIRCEPGDELCRFKNYLYGKRLRGPSTDDGSAVSCGWFPESLVNFD